MSQDDLKEEVSALSASEKEEYYQEKKNYFMASMNEYQQLDGCDKIAALFKESLFNLEQWYCNFHKSIICELERNIRTNDTV